jgi:hypothetical protein
LTATRLVRQPDLELNRADLPVNRFDARTVLAPTASRGGAAVRVIGLGQTFGMTTITMTTTTPPAGTG